MKKKVMEEWVQIFEKSLGVKPKKLEAEQRAIHALVEGLHVRYRLYVKARKKRDKKPLDLKDWIDAGKPEK